MHRISESLVITSVVFPAFGATAPHLISDVEIAYTENTVPPASGDVREHGSDSASATVDRTGIFATTQAHAAYGALDVSGVVSNTRNARASAAATFEDLLYFQIFAEQPFSGNAPLSGASCTVTGNVSGIATASGS